MADWVVDEPAGRGPLHLRTLPLKPRAQFDNPKAAKYSPLFANTASSSGNGLSNNRVFAAASDNQVTIGAQNSLVGNSANQYKIGRYVDLTNTAGSGVYGSTGLMTSSQLNQEFRPYYAVKDGYM